MTMGKFGASQRQKEKEKVRSVEHDDMEQIHQRNLATVFGIGAMWKERLSQAKTIPLK